MRDCKLDCCELLFTSAPGCSKMAVNCKSCEAEITGIEKIACRCCNSVFHRSCIPGLNRAAFDAIVKHPRNMYWLCDDCSGRFDSLLHSMETDDADAPAAATISTKLCEAVDKLNDMMTQLSKRLESPRNSYSGVLRHGSQFGQPGSTPKRNREDDEIDEPPAKPKAVCGTRIIQREIKTVVNECDQFWVYLGRLHHSNTVEDIAEMTRECLSLAEPPKVIRLVKKDVDVTKLPFVSFRVLLPEENRDIALLAETWPTGVAIREFDFDQVRAPRFRQ